MALSRSTTATATALATPCSRRSRRRCPATCAPPKGWGASAATNSPGCFGTSTAPTPPPKPARSKPPSMARRCAGAPRRWSSAPPPASRCSARSTVPPTSSPAPTRRCMRARMSGKRSPPSPRVRGEGWAEGAPPLGSERFQKAQTRGNAPHPGLLPARGEKEALRNNIRRELVFDEGNAVAQLQLALLQALHLDDVGARRILQRRNRGVEVAMLLLQARQLRPKLAFFLLRHRRLGRAVGAVKIAFGAV